MSRVVKCLITTGTFKSTVEDLILAFENVCDGRFVCYGLLSISIVADMKL